MSLPTATDKIRAAQAALNGFIDRHILPAAAINACSNPNEGMAQAMDHMAGKLPDFAALADRLTEAMFVVDGYVEFSSPIADALHDMALAHLLSERAEIIRENLDERVAA